MKTFTSGQSVEIRLPRSKTWHAATYKHPLSGWHVVNVIGEPVKVHDDRIRPIADPDVGIDALRAQIAESGLVLERVHVGGTRYRGGPLDGSRIYTIDVRVPAGLIAEAERAARGGAA